MGGKTWKPYPLRTVMIELIQRKGATTDSELHNMIKEVHGDIGFNMLNKELMCLEIEGVVKVSALTRGKRRVEFVKRKK